jgi:hypothetical protein
MHPSFYFIDYLFADVLKKTLIIKIANHVWFLLQTLRIDSFLLKNEYIESIIVKPHTERTLCRASCFKKIEFKKSFLYDLKDEINLAPFKGIAQTCETCRKVPFQCHISHLNQDPSFF